MSKLDTKTLKAIYILEDLTDSSAENLIKVILADVKEFTSDQYHNWVLAWRKIYSSLTELTHNVKALNNCYQDNEDMYCQFDSYSEEDFSTSKNITLHNLRLISTTLLECRISNKNKRKLQRMYK